MTIDALHVDTLPIWKAKFIQVEDRNYPPSKSKNRKNYRISIKYNPRGNRKYQGVTGIAKAYIN